MANKDSNMGCLFSVEEMTRIDGGFDFKEDQPVTCLGKQFANDAERRAYFREELRKQLPELRKIEGFPIGEDDDIINLSDPPYYTACPNPWLNDFIAEWEKEKEQLKAEGKRSDDFEVKEPYAADVSEGKNNPIYMAHAYHTKVPHPAIMRYILHYTQPGDIVFDGFCGTGMTGVAANLCGSATTVSALTSNTKNAGVRHGLCSDLSPAASLIAAGYNTKFNSESFEKKVKRILEQVESEYGWMYKTKVNGYDAIINYVIYSDLFNCPACGNEIVLWNSAVSEDTKTIFDNFYCPHCGTLCSKRNMSKTWETAYDTLLGTTVQRNKSIPVRINYTLNKKRAEKNIDDADLELLEKINSISLEGYRTFRLLDGGYNTRQPIGSNGITHTHQFYTIRNFIVLSRLWELCGDDINLKNWLTSALLITTRMYAFRTDRKGGIMKGTLYVPSYNIELNPLHTLKGKIRDISAAYYPERGNSIVYACSATKMNTLAQNTIDYIFIDPPFGSNIMYSELNSIWEGWLKVHTDNKDEAIVNSAQNKSLFDYQNLMNASLKEFYRVLKPGKWLTVEFSNTSASVWNSIQNALQGVGFVLVNVAALDKKQGSFKAVTTTTAVKQDLILTCFKPSDKLSTKFETCQDVSNNIWDFISELLEHLPVHLTVKESTTAVVERSPKILYDRLIAYYVQHGYAVPIDAIDFQKGLKERYIEKDGMFFTPVQAAEYEEKKKLAPEFVPMGIIVSDEANGIQWLKNQLRDAPKTYQEIQPEWMQAINGLRKGDILPELKTLLEENFIEEADGKWRLPNIQDDVDKEALRIKALLREFKLYVEAAAKPKVKIKEARVEALRAGFKQCYIDKDFQTIVTVGDKIPQNLLTEDEILLQFYDIAQNKL